ncbi:MAG: efflux RND transporter periplasmic adaptor subunit [Proteobacteria bacterium]|nr:efflux RND transporter periplasmic adaptor subunit [Pseudomonadota bacterium]
MFWARFAALAVVVAAVLWVGSGYLRPQEVNKGSARVNEVAKPLFKVVIAEGKIERHSRRLSVTGRTQSDQRVMVSARTNGLVTRLAVARGAKVAVGDLIAELSDEAREANVTQARARLSQRAAELDAREKLAKQGSYPVLNLEQLRAEKQSAEASLATAEAELLRANILAPITGVINELPVEIGQGLSLGSAVAEIIAPDPMLAVVELAERRLSGVRVGDKAEIRLVTGETRTGEIRFIARKPSGQTRTYRVDIVFSNADGAIADGIAAEVSLLLAPVDATRISRSALTFSAEGVLGLRVVDENDTVQFVPVSLVDDEGEILWVSGVAAGARIIIRGQDFIREGVKVEPVREVSALSVRQ